MSRPARFQKHPPDRKAAPMSEEMKRLRAAIVADIREDMSAIDELNDWHLELVESFNAVPGVDPITDGDLS